MRAHRYKPEDTAARGTLLDKGTTIGTGPLDEGTATGTAPLGEGTTIGTGPLDEGSWHLTSHQQSSVGAAQREAFSLTIAPGLPIRCKSWVMRGNRKQWCLSEACARGRTVNLVALESHE